MKYFNRVFRQLSHAQTIQLGAHNLKMFNDHIIIPYLILITLENI